MLELAITSSHTDMMHPTSACQVGYGGLELAITDEVKLKVLRGTWHHPHQWRRGLCFCEPDEEGGLAEARATQQSRDARSGKCSWYPAARTRENVRNLTFTEVILQWGSIMAF